MYKPAFVHAYKSSKSSLPINVWAKAIGRRLPQFRNEEDIYSPVPLHVKIAGSLNDSNGAVRLSVMPTQSNWYADLTSALCEMTGKRDLQVVSYLGQPIKDMTPEQLMAVGECDCVQSEALDAPIRLASVVPPPLHLSTNKQAELKEWWNNQRSVLAEKIAVQLKGMTMAEIAQATIANGPVQQTIESYLCQNTLHDLQWDKFLAAYGNSGSTSAQAMSNKLLDAVRQSLVANETQIRTHHASVGSEAALWKNQRSAPASRYKDDFTLYRDVIEDAMYHPLVGQEMVHAVLYGTRTVDGRHSKRKHKKKKKKRSSKMGHPINAYYSDYHYEVHGKLPGHRIAALNKPASVDAEYPGDAERAVDMFNLFSGRAVQNVAPQEEHVTSSKLIPLAQAVAYAEQYSGARSSMPELIPISNDMHSSSLPELIPIESRADRAMPELVPIQSSSSDLPELIPIECGACSAKKDKKKDKKGKTRKMNSQMLPELIPIDQSMPPLIPIAHMKHTREPLEVPSVADLCEPIWVDDCPNLMDFLKK